MSVRSSLHRHPAAVPAIWTLIVVTSFSSFLFVPLTQPVRAQTQTPALAWDEDPASSVSGYAVSVDGARTDYGLTPVQNGTCGCSIPLPFSSGRHTVIVSAYNASGETASAPFIVGPTASPGGPYSSQAGAALTVSGASSTDNVGTITSYVWNWGDGTPNTTSTSAAATHTYGAPGTFTITLTVNDDFSASDSATTSATIVASPPGTPTAPNPANGATGVSVTPTLTWTASGATSYDVQFGTTNPPPQVSSGQTGASYSPAGLANGTTYYWQIVARNNGGTTSGPVWSFTTVSAAAPTGDIVMYASDLASTDLHGSWTTAADSSSPNGVKLVTPDAGWSTTSVPLAAPSDYVDVNFSAAGGTPYTVWLRLRALNDNKYNDSVWVQFSDAQVNGSSVYQMDSTTGLLVNLATDSTAASLSGWGWQNGAYWLSQPTTVSFPTTGSHTMRIQVREDGVELDQIVLSPNTYLSGPPGPPTNDSTIVPKTGKPATPGAPNPSDGSSGVSTSPTLTWTAAAATSYDVKFGTTNTPPVVSSGQSAASFTPGQLTANTTYYWQIIAANSSGTTNGPVWSFTTAASTSPTNIVIYASDVASGSVHGAWTTAADSSSPNGIKLTTADNGWATTDAPLASPADYVDVTFTAPAGTPYTLWLRLQALNNSKYNDSVWVQFSDAQVGGSTAYPLNSTIGLLVNLATDSTAASLNRWGWYNSAYWLAQPATVTFSTSGSHTIRIQVREDGVQLDQIVLSPTTYLNTAPGPPTNDSTIVPKP